MMRHRSFASFLLLDDSIVSCFAIFHYLFQHPRFCSNIYDVELMQQYICIISIDRLASEDALQRSIVVN